VSWSSVVDAELDPLCFGGICQNANAGMREIQICGICIALLLENPLTSLSEMNIQFVPCHKIY
jgi:hypothetical protein